MIEVNATDADDATYGNSAKLVYSILQGQPYFSVEPETGESSKHMAKNIFTANTILWFLLMPFEVQCSGMFETKITRRYYWLLYIYIWKNKKLQMEQIIR